VFAEVDDQTNELNDAKYGSYGGGYPGRGGNYGGGYPGNRGGNYGGGYPGNRGGNYGGGYPRNRGGNYCRYGCCGDRYYGSCRRCCSYAGEAVALQTENNTRN